MADIRLITKETDLSHLPKPYGWDVVIDGRPYFIVPIEGHVHSIGGRWGENNFWAYPRDEFPSYGNLIEFRCDEPVSWGIVYEPHNYSKSKWDEAFSETGHKVQITRNGEVFCNVRGSVIEALATIDKFKDHPLDLNSIAFDQEAIGRKIWWRSEPAVITSFIKGQANIILKPDGIPHFTIPAEFAEEDPDYYEDDFVKTSILDNHIWWFRD